jgi:hypothetical protein
MMIATSESESCWACDHFDKGEPLKGQPGHGYGWGLCALWISRMVGGLFAGNAHEVRCAEWTAKNS